MEESVCGKTARKKCDCVRESICGKTGGGGTV